MNDKIQFAILCELGTIRQILVEQFYEDADEFNQQITEMIEKKLEK